VLADSHPLSKGFDVLDLLTSLGWDDARSAEFAPLATSAVPARVSRVDRGVVDVLTADNPLRVPWQAGDPRLAVGDWVALTAADRRWQVDSVLERRSAIRRASVGGESADQMLATNVDLVLVVVPAVPEPRLGMAERLVALAWDSGATPVVVLTKADLVPDPDGIADDLRAGAPGVDVLTVTAASVGGFDPVRSLLVPGQTVCLLGRSGAGKSTLANAMLDEERFATQDIRADGKGRHTTSFRELVALPGGGVLIDTPGLRGVGLWLEGDGLERAFADVEELILACRFSDCAHDTEPGCAVLAALEGGTLDERRFASWRKLQREAQWMARRTDARLRAEQVRRWKAVSTEMRRSRRARP
jgi:ribosome biogenesis GTPase / thiamine phosphate phosphatase